MCGRVNDICLIDLSAVLIELDRKKDAETLMILSDFGEWRPSSDLPYRNAAPRLNPRRPRQAPTILDPLSRAPLPRHAWLASLIKTYLERDRTTWANQVLDRFLHLYPEKPEAWELAVWAALQRFDHATAAAAMEPASLDPSNGDRTEKLIRLCRVADAPVKAARAFRKILGARPSP